jgi:hypothetical protein
MEAKTETKESEFSLLDYHIAQLHIADRTLGEAVYGLRRTIRGPWVDTDLLPGVEDLLGLISEYRATAMQLAYLISDTEEEDE